MSDDVITLDSSDEESKPENEKPKAKTPTEHPIVKNVPISQSRPVVVSNQTNQLRPVIKNSTVFPKIKGPKPNPFNTQIRNSLNSNNIRPIRIKPNAAFQSNNFTPLPIGNNLGPVQPFFQGRQFNALNYVNTPIRLPGSVSFQMPKTLCKPTKMPIIVNARTLTNTHKKIDSQNFISALPAGITVTRTSSKSSVKKSSTLPDKVVLKRKTQVVNPLKILQPPEITTVELDDDDEDDYNRVGEEIPVEFECASDENKKITSVDIKENEKTSTVVEVPPNDSTLNESLETNDKHDTEIVDKNSNTADEPVDEDIAKDIRKTVISYYTPKKNEGEEVTAKDNKAVKKVIIDVIELTDSPVKSCDDNGSKGMNNEVVSDDIKSVEIKENDDQPSCSPKLSPVERSASPSKIDPTTIKDVIVKVVMKPDDVIKVEEYIKSSPKKNNHEQNPSDDSERKINETYQKFIDLCFELDKSDDMEKIIRKRVKGYYMLVHPSFTESKSFCKFVEGKIAEISANPGSLFLYIKDVVDELKVRRVKTKKSSAEQQSLPCEAKEQDEEAEASEGGEKEDEEDSVITARIHKLERAMRKLSKAIEKLEEREVDYDDEEDSAYLLADRYKSRLVRVYRKLCTLTGERDEARRSASVRGLSRLVLCGGRLPRLTAAVKAAAISRPHWFPDYMDVYKCVEHCAKEQDLVLRPDELQREAREAFVEIGTLLQQRRREQEYEELSWKLGTHSDPAEEDPELAAALLKNRELSKHREMEVINKFAEKQSNLKLVAEVVQDADADKSDGSSEESDDDSLSIIEESFNPSEKDTADDEKANESSKTATGDNVKKGDHQTKDNDKDKKDQEEPSCSATLSEICDYLKLEKQTPKPKKPEEISRKRKFIEDYNDVSDNSVSSCLSFIELSSSDSQESTKSEGDKKRKCNGDFKRLKSIRPSSAMSGINVIEDGSSHSCGKFENVQNKSSSDIVMEVEDSNDVVPVPSKGCEILDSESLDKDDNAMDGTLREKLVIEDKDDGNECTKDVVDITDKETDTFCKISNVCTKDVVDFTDKETDTFCTISNVCTKNVVDITDKETDTFCTISNVCTKDVVDITDKETNTFCKISNVCTKDVVDITDKETDTFCTISNVCTKDVVDITDKETDIFCTVSNDCDKDVVDITDKETDIFCTISDDCTKDVVDITDKEKDIFCTVSNDCTKDVVDITDKETDTFCTISNVCTKDVVDITDKETDIFCAASNDESNRSQDERSTEPVHIINSDGETHATYPTDENNLLEEICVKSSDREHHGSSKKVETNAEEVIALDDENCDVDKGDAQTPRGDPDIEIEESYSDEKNLLQTICEKDSEISDEPMETNSPEDDANNCIQDELVAKTKNNADELCRGGVNGGLPDDDDVELSQEFYEGEIDIVEHDVTSLSVENKIL